MPRAAHAVYQAKAFQTLALLTLVVGLAVETTDYALRLREGGSAALLARGDAYLIAEVSSTLRALVLAFAATFVIVRAGAQATVALGALVFALYAAMAALGYLGPALEASSAITLLVAGVLSALNLAATRFFQLFPEPVINRRLPRVLALFARPLPLIILCSLPVIRWFLPQIPGFIIGVWNLIMVVLQFAYLRVNLNADPQQRQRLFWFAEGMLLIVLTVALYPLAAVALRVTGAGIDTRPALWIATEFGHIGALACFIVAIFFRDALNAGLVVKRTFAAGLASGASLIVFIALETLASSAFESILRTESRIGSIAAGVLAALVFKPVQAGAEALFARLTAHGRAVETEQP